MEIVFSTSAWRAVFTPVASLKVRGGALGAVVVNAERRDDRAGGAAGFGRVLILVGLEQRAEAIVLTPDQSHPIGHIIRAMLPRIEAIGVATAGEIDVDTLDERLLAERLASSGSCILEMVFGAWARKKS